MPRPAPQPTLLLAAALLAACAGGLVPTSQPTAPPSSTPSPATAPTTSVPTAVEVMPGEPWIVYQGGKLEPLRLVRPDGTDDHVLIEGTLPGHLQGHPAWSPEGETIAFDLYTANEFPDHVGDPLFDDVAIWAVDADGGNPRQLAACSGPPCLQLAYPAWSPDGRQVALIRYDLNPDQSWGKSGIEILEVASGERRTVAESADGRTAYYTPRWSPDGRSIVVAVETYTDETEVELTSAAIAVIDIDGQHEPRILTPLELFAAEPDWAPADRIVFRAGDDAPTNGRVMTISPDGTGLAPVTAFAPGDGAAIEPTWISDAMRIMFVRTHAAGQSIAFINPDGSGLIVAEWSLQTPVGRTERTHAHLRP